MSLFSIAKTTVAAQALRKHNKNLTEAGAEYLAKLYIEVMAKESDPHKVATMAAKELIKRVTKGDAWATAAATEDLLKYRPVFEKAVQDGKDPVVELALAFPFGRELAQLHVDLFRLVDGS